jgi:DNA topoisomerase-2
MDTEKIDYVRICLISGGSFKHENVSYIEVAEYIIKGIYNKIDTDVIEITELPIGVWTTPYREYLDKLSKANIIDSYRSNCTDERVHYTIILNNGLLDKLESNNTLMTKFKLIKKVNINNVHAYNASYHMTKYNSTNDILKDYYDIRLEYYNKRKEYLINKLTKELNILKYKVMFIEYVLDKKIIIERQKKADIINKLVEFKFPKILNNNETEETYDYLTEIPLFSLTMEKIEELNNKYKNKDQELAKIKSVSEFEQWTIELDEFI